VVRELCNAHAKRGGMGGTQCACGAPRNRVERGAELSWWNRD
jgi:hypothetical protein